MEDVGKRIGSRPGFGEVTVKIHLIVSLEQAAEEEPIDPLGLGIGGEARIEVGGTRFDEEGQRRRIALGCVKAAGRRANEQNHEEEKRKRISAVLTKTQRARRKEAGKWNRKRSACSVSWKVSVAGHRRFYREWQGRARQWPTEDSRGADGMVRKQAGQRQRLPCRLRQSRIAKRGERGWQGRQPKAARGSTGWGDRRLKQ